MIKGEENHMIARGEKIFVGFDLNDEFSQICYWKDGMREPVSISTVVNEEKFMIPTAVCRTNDGKNWLYGDEANKCANRQQGVLINDLINKSITGQIINVLGEKYEAFSLLELFVKRTLNLISTIGKISDVECLTFTLRETDKARVDIVKRLAKSLMIDEHKVCCQDYKESFFYYCLNQRSELWNRNVVLFDYRKSTLKGYTLKINNHTNPKVVSISEGVVTPMPDGNEAKDKTFADVIAREFDGQIVTGVFLTGQGFSEEWLKVSLKLLCQRRRVFFGQNLYALGACYSGIINRGEESWNYLYLGDSKIKTNLEIDTMNNNRLFLIKAGENWYDCDCEVELILDDSQKIELIVSDIWERFENRKVVELVGMPIRKPNTTRVKMKIEALSNSQVSVSITDLGFGEMFKGTYKEWKQIISF